MWLKLRNQDQLEHLSHDLYDSSSPKYQHFLTKNEFDSLYGPSQDSINLVQRYFTSQGAQAEVIDNHVKVTATPAQIEQAINTKIYNYQYKGRVFYKAAEKPQIDYRIAPYISGITGLDNMQVFYPMYRRSLGNQNKPSPSAVSPYKSFTGAAMQQAYNLNGIQPINGTAINGAGQTIILIETCNGDSPSVLLGDTNIFSAANNLPIFTSSNFSVIGQTGGTPPTTGSGCDTGWSIETSLDIQAAHTMAPFANIVVILADDAGGGILVADNYAVQNYPAAVISHSFGGIEGPSPDISYDNILLQSVVQGQSLTFSTGDSGDNVTPSGTLTPSVQYPASSRYSIAVGGTSLYVNANNTYLFEAGWGYYNSTIMNSQTFQAGAGGGVSSLYAAQPAQASAISSFVAGGYNGAIGASNCNGSICRALPDIAMAADAFTGLTIYNSSQVHGFGTIGGTSLASPLVAGTLALVNQARSIVVGGQQNPIGLITPYLYNQIDHLKRAHALHVASPPHFFLPNTVAVSGYPSAFYFRPYLFNVDTALTIPENQFWNDVVGVGTPNLPNFISSFSTL